MNSVSLPGGPSAVASHRMVRRGGFGLCLGLCLGLGLGLGLWLGVALPALPAAPVPTLAVDVDWSRLTEPGVIEVALPAGPRIFSLPTPASNVVAMSLLGPGAGSTRESAVWVFNQDATRLQVELPAVRGGGGAGQEAAVLVVEVSETTRQLPDGRIVFSALDAVVQGNKARLETHPGNHRIGFWTEAADSVSWSYKPTRWGRYDVELAYSADGGRGTEVVVEVAGQRLAAARPGTGSWYRYRTLPLGRIYLAKSDPFQVKVSCPSLKGPAALNLKAVILRPAPEGEPIFQQPGGDVALHARDALTHSTTMRYEPATNKNCLGYWVNPRDWAEWEFTLSQPGTFEVELWQGCGKGQGGSEVAVQAGGSRLSFVVEDTGHFQNFVPRRLGRVTFASRGPQRLAVLPIRKQGAAVMDVRLVRLIPVP